MFNGLPEQEEREKSENIYLKNDGYLCSNLMKNINLHIEEAQ